jgi:hypothetical protein
MATNGNDPAARASPSPPPNLCHTLLSANDTIASVIGTRRGVNSATLHVLFSHGEPIKAGLGGSSDAY